MLLGRVSSEVWGARQAERLEGHKLLVVDVLSARVAAARGCSVGARELLPAGRQLVAVDALGAGIGELVLVAHGSRCRDLTLGPAVPTKDVIVAIVDDAELAREGLLSALEGVGG